MLFFNRFVRGTVGPLFISLALMMVLSTFVIGDVMLQTSPGVWLASHIKNTFRESTLAMLIAISFSLSGVLASLGLLWIVRQYRRRHLNDQTFLFDSLWLSTSCWVCVYLMGDSQRFSVLARTAAVWALQAHREIRTAGPCRPRETPPERTIALSARLRLTQPIREAVRPPCRALALRR